MNIEHLVRMANQIGEFFQAMPDRAEAVEGVASHIAKFWAPRMRAQLAEHLAVSGGAGLLPIVVESLRQEPVMAPPVEVEPGDGD
jgi:formate dehydrogenase subunit delta